MGFTLFYLSAIVLIPLAALIIRPWELGFADFWKEITAPRVLAAFAERAGGDVLLGAPDRGAVLALPASLPSSDRFQRRVLKEWREAMNPCSRELLITDGQRLRAVSRRSQTSGPVVLPWLAE